MYSEVQTEEEHRLGGQKILQDAPEPDSFCEIN